MTTDAASTGGTGGVLPIQAIRDAIGDGCIQAMQPIEEAQLQPASLDLRLADKGWRVMASFLPGPDHTVAERLAELGDLGGRGGSGRGGEIARSMYAIDLSEPTVLERGCVYIVPLQERLDLPDYISGIASPKSSIGRLDIFTRLITDSSPSFETVAPGYHGPLYLEIAPRTFSVVVRAGDRLNQLRLRHGDSVSSDETLRATHGADPVLFEGGRSTRADIDRGLWVSVDLADRGAEPIAYRGRRHAPLIDLARVNAYDPTDFWEPIHGNGRGRLILNPDDFYLLASREGVRVPSDRTAEMVPYDTSAGEFRVHYAGFFDPGFGQREGGTPAVLEVRSHEVPFVLEHGQRVARMVYERLLAVPDRLYGEGIGSHYADQRLTLSKHFRRG